MPALLLHLAGAPCCIFDPPGLYSSVGDSQASIFETRPERGQPEGGPQDTDGDRRPDSQDNCPTVRNKNQEDTDQDKLGDVCDNCPDKKNLDQQDIDKDKLGDVCDPDIDGDKVPNSIDPRPKVKDSPLYFGYPGSKLGNFETYGGWTPSGKDLCQKDPTDTTLHLARLLPQHLSQTNYTVHTRIVVNGSTVEPSEPPMVGLIFRAGSVAGGKVSCYGCGLNPDKRHLAIGEFSGGEATYFQQSADGSVPVSGPYTMTVTVQGNNLSCNISPPGLMLSDIKTTFGAGTVGFVSYRSDVCFDYLLVL